jgi:acetyltransferase
MAIHPYPSAMAEHWQLADGSDLLVRPIRPEDAEMERAFVEGLSPESRYYRFMYRVDKLSPMMLARFTQIDYDRELALVAIAAPDGPEPRIIGVARYVANPDGESCEFALTVADDLQHQGMGRRLMQQLMNAARDRGLEVMEGEVLAANRRMLRLCEGLGFRLVYSREEPDVVAVRRHL